VLEIRVGVEAGATALEFVGIGVLPLVAWVVDLMTRLVCGFANGEEAKAMAPKINFVL
jgi:uncharacterized membrane protein